MQDLSVHPDRPITIATTAAPPARRVPMLLHGILLLAVLTSGLSAGLFYVFEVAVTPGLETVDDRTYIAAFQGINAVIRNAPFGIAFFGPIVLATLALALFRKDRRVALLVGGGLAVYLVGVFGVTFAFHVPRNEALAAYQNLATTDLPTVRTWFEGPWNAWNLVRTIAACASFGLFCLALLLTPSAPRAVAWHPETGQDVSSTPPHAHLR